MGVLDLLFAPIEFIGGLVAPVDLDSKAAEKLAAAVDEYFGLDTSEWWGDEDKKAE